MSGSEFNAVDLDPPIPEGLTAAQLITLWAELYDAGEALLLAGLRREIGPDGDLIAAYRIWLQEEREERDRELIAMAQRRTGGRRDHAQ